MNVNKIIGCGANDGLILQPHFDSGLTQAPTVMAALSPGLMAAAPDRPGEHLRRIGQRTPDQSPEEAPDLRDREWQQEYIRLLQTAPFSASWACRRVIARKAWASSASVMWRYHPTQRRTSY